MKSRPMYAARISHAKRIYRTFQRLVWRGVLDPYVFRNLSEVREIIGKWRLDYNNARPSHCAWEQDTGTGEI